MSWFKPSALSLIFCLEEAISGINYPQNSSWVCCGDTELSNQLRIKQGLFPCSCVFTRGHIAFKVYFEAVCWDYKMGRVSREKKAAKSGEKGQFGCNGFSSSSSLSLLMHHQHHCTRNISYRTHAVIAWWDATIFLVKARDFCCNKQNKHMNNKKKSQYMHFEGCSKVDYEAVTPPQAAHFLKIPFAAETPIVFGQST